MSNATYVAGCRSASSRARRGLESARHFHRLRVHARGRDTAIDLAPDEVTEWYLIQVWPAPVEDAVVLRHTDSYGASVRAR